MGPTWGPFGADRTQVGPMLAELCYLGYDAWSWVRKFASIIGEWWPNPIVHCKPCIIFYKLFMLWTYVAGEKKHRSLIALLSPRIFSPCTEKCTLKCQPFLSICYYTRQSSGVRERLTLVLCPRRQLFFYAQFGANYMQFLWMPFLNIDVTSFDSPVSVACKKYLIFCSLWF